MRILFLSFYFRPDLSAGSFRATALVDALTKLAPTGSEIDVLTTRPNRYKSFAADAAEAPAAEAYPGVSIARFQLPPHKGGFIDQSKAYLAYARWALSRTAGREYDLVVVTSGRLMSAVLAAWIARRARAPLYLDIRDIFVDTIKDVLPRTSARIVTPLFARLERFAVSRAAKVNLVSAGFADYFRSRYPRQRFSYFTNGIDDEFLSERARTPDGDVPAGVDRPLTILYAGNIGDGQGLHSIIPQLAQRMGDRFRFRIIGDGGKRLTLEAAIKATGTTNVQLHPPMKRRELLEAYRTADVLFLHLNDYEAFEKVLPSKLFEYAALGKPVWAGVAGYSAGWITSEISNSAVFRPCDVADAERSFRSLALEDTPRPDFIAKYSRANISRDLANDILSVTRGDRA